MAARANGRAKTAASKATIAGEVPNDGGAMAGSGAHHGALGDVWADIIGGAGPAESDSPADYDAFRKRLRAYEHELEKPPTAMRKLAAEVEQTHPKQGDAPPM